MASIQKGEIGKKIILNVTATITGSTVRKIYYKKPESDTSSSWNAAEESSTSISYTTLLNDIDEVGVWELQAYVETASWKLPGEVAELTVKENLF